jgi:DNA-3-methyladenine glycosylase II
MARFFEYGDEEVAYLKARDPKLAAAIDAVGHVNREMMEEGDLFAAVVHHIIGQQISSAAQATVWARLQEALGEITPAAVCAATSEQLQSCGTSFKKVEYIKGFAEKVASAEFDLDAVAHMPDGEAIKALSSLPGIGEWTAEMLLLFCLGRPDILSFGDLAIHRGMRMIYHHRKVTRAMFEKYRRRYSPYGSVASLYLWAVSHMDVPGYDRDYAPMTEAQKKAARKKRAAKTEK